MTNFQKSRKWLKRLLDRLVIWLSATINAAIYQLKLLPYRPHLWWHKAWIRNDEFDRSLDLDAAAMMRMNKADREKYMADLMRRRNLAHERDLDT